MSSGQQRASQTRTADLLVAVATRFYLHGEPQIRIARSLGIDPSTVSRLLKRARDDGIVRIEIGRPFRQESKLGRELAEAYQLHRAIVVAVDYSVPDDSSLPAAAARFVDDYLKNGMRFGVSWGRTLADVVRHLTPGTVSGVRVAQLSGGLSGPVAGIQGHELARQVAELYPNSRVHYMLAPAIVDSVAIRDVMLADSSIGATLAAGIASDVALVGVGSIDPSATLVEAGHLGPEEQLHLAQAGAVGNVNVRFFGIQGERIPILEGRTIGISLDELKKIPTVIAVAAGANKIPAIAGALRTGAINVLVTDAPTASALLTISTQRRAG